MKIIKIADKKEYLRKMNIPEDIIDYALYLSPKYSVWIARELNKAQTKHHPAMIDLYPEIKQKLFSKQI